MTKTEKQGLLPFLKIAGPFLKSDNDLGGQDSNFKLLSIPIIAVN